MIKITYIRDTYLRSVDLPRHKYANGYYALIVVQGRKYIDQTDTVRSRYQAVKLAKKHIRDYYTVGGTGYEHMLESNPLI